MPAAAAAAAAEPAAVGVAEAVPFAAASAPRDSFEPSHPF